MSKIDHSLFAADEHALEEAYGLCPECGGKLCIRHGKSGPFIGCSHYPECHYTKNLHEHETSEIKRLDGSACPLCASELAIKKGRFGLFIGCSNFPTCHYIGSLKSPQADTHISCPECKSGHLVSRTSKFGKTFYACNGFPKCRYAVNSEPVNYQCPECFWPIMLKKKISGKDGLICPVKSCQHKFVPE